LILTKQLGTGVLTSAVKLGKMKEVHLKPAIASMLMLNKTASRAAISAGAEAATDVTGFGLIGHALNMAKNSCVNLVISYKSVPLMKGIKNYIKAGIIPGGAKRTLEFCGRDVVFSSLLSEVDKFALADPQTSGGLLIALPEKSLKRFHQITQREKMPYWIIGRVIKGRGKVIVE
jgi:selenide,water dikinase